MQPNPGDTTNALMVQLIQIIADPNAVHAISNLSSSTSYSSSTAWTQALAYASLVFSVLAAFGAVMGKQWLSSYKAARERESLEERGMKRQWKLDRLENWHLKAVLRTFFILLQIALLLFGLSLSATMWFQQRKIFYVVISTTGPGMLFFMATTLVSIWRPNSPFQTPVSKLARKLLSVKSTFTHDSFIKSSAVRWVLETSTMPEVVDAAAAMVLRVQWPAARDVSAAYTRLLDNFKAYHDTPERCMNYGRAMAHLCIQPVEIHRNLISGGHGCWDPLDFDRGRFICDAFQAGHDAWKRFRDVEVKDAELLKYKADIRTALRTMVVHGRGEHLSRPDDEKLIWYGDWRWWRNEELAPSCAEFDWLVDYVMFQVDDETKGDALLALSAIPDLGSSAKRDSYVTTLIHCMGHEHPRIRYTALRVVLDARVELARPANDFPVSLLDDLSRALLTAVNFKNGQTVHASGSDTLFHHDRDRCYFRLIFALTKDGGWRDRLIRDGHVKRCISLVKDVLENPRSSHNFYLAGIFLHIVSSGGDPPSKSLSIDNWRKLVKAAWRGFFFFVKEDEHTCFEVLPALVKVTEENFQGQENREPNLELPGQTNKEPNSELPGQNIGESNPELPDRKNGEPELQDLIGDVQSALKKLQKRRETPGQEDELVDALQAVQGLCEYLSPTVHPNPSPDNPRS
jgi:hypothetical protein